MTTFDDDDDDVVSSPRAALDICAREKCIEKKRREEEDCVANRNTHQHHQLFATKRCFARVWLLLLSSKSLRWEEE